LSVLPSGTLSGL